MDRYFSGLSRLRRAIEPDPNRGHSLNAKPSSRVSLSLPRWAGNSIAIFEICRSVELVDGRDLTIVATGLLVAEAIRAQEALDAEGISARVIDMFCIKPLDRAAIERAATETRALVVAEEHLVSTGLGVRVSQVVAETHPCPMEFVGIQDTYAESGAPEELMEKYGLVARNIVAASRRVINRK